MPSTKSRKATALAGLKPARYRITHHGVTYDNPDKETLNRVLAAQSKEIATEAAARAAAPQWVNYTPEWLEEYTLTMWVNSADEQRIEVTRAEFIALKAHLAKVRGIKAEPQQQA